MFLLMINLCEVRVLKHTTLKSPPHSFSLQNGVPPPSPGPVSGGGGDSLLSPPSVASLLDISLPGPPEEALAPGEPQTHISDSIIELAINSAHYGASPCFILLACMRRFIIGNLRFKASYSQCVRKTEENTYTTKHI